MGPYGVGFRSRSARSANDRFSRADSPQRVENALCWECDFTSDRTSIVRSSPCLTANEEEAKPHPTIPLPQRHHTTFGPCVSVRSGGFYSQIRAFA